MTQISRDAAVKTGVRVAIIDSGINPRRPHVLAVRGGIAFSLTDEGEVRQSDDYIDRRGHGTALAGIICAKAPQAELYAVKIFHDPRTPNDPLTTSIAVLEAGFRWAIEQEMRVINLSLGTSNPDHRARLDALVMQAHNTGSIVVASASPGDTTTLPAALPGVIGVAGDDACAWNEYQYIRDDPIPFRAHPRPRPIPGLPQERNFHGHSCASAHVTALVALLLQRRADLTAAEALFTLTQVIEGKRWIPG
jgi:subtilisin family serine protease